MRILLAEDNRTIAALVRTILEQNGHLVWETDNGLEALQYALVNTPDLAILDGSMPTMDGWEVCRRVKAQKALPVLMLTVHAEHRDRELAEECGADGYMIKPFEIPRFLAELERIVQAASTPMR